MSAALSSRIAPLGDMALLVRVGERSDAATFQRVQALAQHLERARLPGMVEYVPALTTVAVYYDPLRVSYGALAAALEQALDSLDPAATAPGRLLEIPVCYGGEFGGDLDVVAQHHGLSAAEVIAIHAGGEYFVQMLGFAPGFPYLGGMAESIATPRRATPRIKVPAGSVGIAGAQTGIYPFETPGGWQLIGRTPLLLFRPQDDPPTLLQTGDRVRFEPITPEEFATLQEMPQ